MSLASARTATREVDADLFHGAGGPSSAKGPIVDEATLVAALQAREDWAFDTVVRVYGGRLLALAQRLTKNHEDALDVRQSAYLNAFRAAGEFEGNCQLATWLHRIVVNTALMKLRSQRRKPAESIEALRLGAGRDGHHDDRLVDRCARADTMIERKQTRARVRSCIQQLPERYRVVLLLRDIEERSNEEVADILRMTPAGVKTRLHRARQALSKLLHSHSDRDVRAAIISPRVLS